MKKIDVNYDKQIVSTENYNVARNYDVYENLNSQQFRQQLENINKLKEEDFKNRLKIFNNAATLVEAKELLQKNMPISNKKAVFHIGNALCTIINEEDSLRISYVHKKECIYYLFK